MKAIKTVPRGDLQVLYEKIDIPWSLPIFHYHNIYEIYILESGERTLIVNNKVFETKGGDVALFNPNEFHRSYGTTPFSGICFHFSVKYLDLYFTEEAKRRLLKCFSKTIISLDEKALREIKDLAECIENNIECKFVYLVMVFEILNRYSKKINEKASVRQVLPALDYINENFASIKDLEQIAEANFISKTHLCRIFKNKIGMTVSQYLNTIRIQYSCELLTDTAKSIAEIAELSGYTSVNYYERVFKKLMGYTPLEFRDKRQTEVYGNRL